MVTRNRIGVQAVSGTPTTTQTSTGDPSKDNRTPSNPTSLHASTALEYGAGVYTTAVTLAWTLPTTATDGTPMTPLQTQVWQFKGTATGGVFARASDVDIPDAAVLLHGYGPGSTWQFKVRVLGANGKLSAFSNTITVTMAGDSSSTPPPMPSIPVVSSRMTMVQLDWDGLATGGAAMPADFDHVLIQRSPSALFATGVTPVGEMFGDGTYVDGPLTVGATWYYRLVAYNRLGLAGPAGSAGTVVVAGSGADDIGAATIDASKFTDELNAQIEQAISSTSGNDLPGNHVFLSDTPPADAVTGDLWFDSSDANRPLRLPAGADPTDRAQWVSVRDSIVNSAFAGPGNAITAPYLLPAVVQGQFIAAGVVDAGQIIAEGTITAASGIVGDLDAGVLKSGFIDSARIDADTITSKQIVVADYTNLCDEPEFDGAGLGWVDPREPPVGTDGPVAIPDHPVAGAAGFAWSVTGNGGVIDSVNTRTVPVVDTDQFYGEVWVRKTAAGTTGTVSLLLHCDVKGGTPATQLICSHTFTTAEPAGTWIKLSGFLVPPPVPKPAPDKTPPSPPPPPWAPSTAPVLPANTYQVTPVLEVSATVGVGQVVQFASPVVRRKNNANLVVDGTITASQLAAQTITAAEIATNTITADNILSKTITTDEVHALTLTADVMDTGMLTGMMIAGNQLRTNQPGVYPALTLSSTSMDFSTSASKSLFQFNFASGAMYWKSDIAPSTRWEIDGAGIRLYDATNTATVNLNTNGSAMFKGDISGSRFIAGDPNSSYLASSSSGMRVVLDNTGLAMYSDKNSPVFQLLESGGTVLLTSKPGNTASNNTTAGWTLSSQGLFFADGTKTTVALRADGSAVFSGTVTASTITSTTMTGGTITGATIQTSTANPRIVMDPTHFQMTNPAGDLLVRFLYSTSSGSGAIHLDTGPSALPRFYFDSNIGMIWYDKAGNVDFRLDAATGNVTISGTISASTINGSDITGGTLTGASIRTGTANPRIILDSTNGIRAYDSAGAYTFYATMQGNAYFKGTVNASTVNSSTVNGPTISGGSWGNGSLSSSIWSGGSLAGTIANGGIVSGGTLRTSAGANRVQVVNDQIQFFSTGVQSGLIAGDPSSVALNINPVSAAGSIFIGYPAGSMGFQITSTFVFSDAIYGSTGTSGSPVYVTSGGHLFRFTSSRRYKQRIAALPRDPGFLAVRPATWTDKPTAATMRVRAENPGARSDHYTGFLAEDLHAAGLHDAVVYDRMRRPDSVQLPAVLAHTVTYTQWLVDQVNQLSARVADLEGAAA